MKSLSISSISALISFALLVACDYHRYEKVHVKVFFAEEVAIRGVEQPLGSVYLWPDSLDISEPFEADVNYLDIYKDRIELVKWLTDKKGDGRFVVLVFEKSEINSLHFQSISN